MADTETTWTPQIAVAEAGPARKRLTITVPAEAVDDRIETSYGALQTEAAVPGFRRGRVPRALLERRFGSTLIQEARSQLLADAYSRAIESKGLKPISQPELEEAVKDLKLERGKGFTFSVDVEVVPEFELPKYEGMTIRRPVAELPESMVDLELRRNCFRFGTPQRIDGPFKPLDRLLGKVVVRIGGKDEVFFESNDGLVVVPDVEDKGRGQLLGLMFDDLGPRLEGHSVGEALVFETTGPENHEREELRGAAIRIEYTVREAERIEPANPESLAETLGLGTVENLRAQVRLGLERRRDSEQRAAMREQVNEHLVAACDFALPEKLSQQQVQRQLEMMRIDLLQRGLDAEQVETRLAELRGASEADAKRRLKLFFILAKLAEHFKVEITEAEVNGRIAAIASQRNMRPEQVRAELERANRMGDIQLSIREAKTADRVIDRAKVSDVDAAEWNKEVESRRAGGAGAAGKSKPAAASKSAASASKPAPASKPPTKSGSKGSGRGG